MTALWGVHICVVVLWALQETVFCLGGLSCFRSVTVALKLWGSFRAVFSRRICHLWEERRKQQLVVANLSMIVICILKREEKEREEIS